jgi:hypothetical protein
MASWSAESLTRHFPIEAQEAKAFDRFCTGPEKPESRDVSRGAQLTAAKVSKPRFRGKVRNCLDIATTDLHRLHVAKLATLLMQLEPL